MQLHIHEQVDIEQIERACYIWCGLREKGSGVACIGEDVGGEQ